MPRGDGTGPDGNGPKKVNKGWPTPTRDGRGQGKGGRRGQGQGLRKRDGSCKGMIGTRDKKPTPDGTPPLEF